MPLIDISGKRFGRLVVTGRAPNTTGDARWHCHCDCGAVTIAWGSNLRTGNTQSCGCLKTSARPERRAQLAGRRFGRLIAISIDPSSSARNKRWLCLCDCGKTKVVRADRLTRSETISCGCAVAGPLVATRSLRVRQEAAAKIRGLIGIVAPAEVDDLYRKQHGRCPNCGADLACGYHRDHVVPVSRGGLNVIANIQLLCVPCNRRKYNKMPWEFALEQGRLV